VPGQLEVLAIFNQNVLVPCLISNSKLQLMGKICKQRLDFDVYFAQQLLEEPITHVVCKCRIQKLKFIDIVHLSLNETQQFHTRKRRLQAIKSQLCVPL